MCIRIAERSWGKRWNVSLELVAKHDALLTSFIAFVSQSDFCSSLRALGDVYLLKLGLQVMQKPPVVAAVVGRMVAPQDVHGTRSCMCVLTGLDG